MPWRVLMPVLPPTEESTWASSVVGTWMKSTPRSSTDGGEAGEVADHAAAQRHQRRLAVGAPVEQLVHQPAEAREVLAALARGHGDQCGVDAGLVERGGERAAP